MTSKNKWTPGPWAINKALVDCATGPVLQITTEAKGISRWHIATVKRQGNQTEPNARLIAAAPEMADALRNALSFCQCEAMLDRTTFARVDWTTLRDAARLRAEQINAILARLEGEK